MRQPTLNHLSIVVTKTADGLSDYVQIMSADMLSVNVVLVADAIEVKDSRPKPKRKQEGGAR